MVTLSRFYSSTGERFDKSGRQVLQPQKVIEHAVRKPGVRVAFGGLRASARTVPRCWIENLKGELK
jgi:hypothetical protein